MSTPKQAHRYARTAEASSCHPLLDALDVAGQHTIKDTTGHDQDALVSQQRVVPAKCVSFHQGASESTHGARLPIDRSTGSASTASTSSHLSSTACSDTPSAASVAASSSSSTGDSGWLFYGGMGSTTQANALGLCPCCGTKTLAEKGPTILTGACDNHLWHWNGEPPFCCLCATLKGLGRLSHFGCAGCKIKRQRFYKKTSWFNHTCKHCSLPKDSHEHNGGKAAYPRCPDAPARSSTH